MALRFAKYIIAVFCALSIVALTGCKKNSTAPQVDSLTRPVIWLNTFELSFSVFEAGGNPEPQILEVKNTGIDTLNYEISCNEEWIEVEPTHGSSSGQIQNHEISIKKAGLKAQDEPYKTTIRITDTNSINNPQEVRVTLTVTEEPPPKIGVSPKNLSFTAQKGGSNPPSQAIEIQNTGEGTLKYEIESDSSWLSVSPDSGTSRISAKTHKVLVSTDGLNVGNYSGTLKIRDPNATNSPQTVKVNFSITKEPAPEIWVSTKSMIFRATEGGNDAPSKTLKIRNSGGGTLNYNINWDEPRISVSPASGKSTGDTNSHNVSVDASGLNAGNYYGTITVFSSNASNSPQNVSVTIEISAPIGDNRIWVSVNPSSAFPNDTVNVTIGINGNQQQITAFGLILTYDTDMFQYQGTSKGNLTGNWGFLDGNDNNGTVTIGGAMLSGTPISVGSQGTLAVVTMRVTGSGYNNGQQSQLSISAYTDDIVGMKPEPANTTFTLKK